MAWQKLTQPVNNWVSLLTPKAVFSGKAQISPETLGQVILPFILQHIHMCFFWAGFLCAGWTGWEVWVGASWWGRRGSGWDDLFISSSQKAAQRSGWGDLAPQLAEPVLVLNVPHPKKHLGPGQIRIVVQPTTDNDITDLSESRWSREPRQVLHLCEWLMPLLYMFAVSWVISWYFPLHLCSIVLLHQQPTGSPAFKWTMPPCRTVQLKTHV